MNHTAEKIGVGFVTALTIASTNPGKISSNEAKQILSNKSLIEHIYVNGYGDGDSFLANAIQNNDSSKVQLIKENCTFETPVKPTPLTKQSDKRATFFGQEYFPQIIPDGKYDKTKFAKEWSEQIKEALAKQRQFFEFAVTPIDKNNIILETKGLLPEINSRKKLNLGIMVYHDWKSVNIKDDAGNTITTQRYLIDSYPNGPLGLPVTIEYGKSIKQGITFNNISDIDQNMMGAIFYIQDMNTKEVLSAAQYCFAKEKDPAYFIWNNWPKTFKPFYGTPEMANLNMYTGLGEMKFSVKNAKDLKYLSFKISKTDEDVYNILGAKLGKNIKVSKFTYDEIEQMVTMEFEKPLNGDIAEICSFINHFKKKNWEKSSSYKIENFTALNSKKESIYYDINDIKQYYPVVLFVDVHPLDLNNDTLINNKDLDLLLERFGTRKGDKLYDPKFNVDDTGFSKDRVDILDVIKLNKEVYEQEKLQKEVDAANQRQIVLSHPPPKTSELLGVDMMITHIQPLL